MLTTLAAGGGAFLLFKLLVSVAGGGPSLPTKHTLGNPQTQTVVSEAEQPASLSPPRKTPLSPNQGQRQCGMNDCSRQRLGR